MTRLFPSAEGRGSSKKRARPTRNPPLLILMQVMCLPLPMGRVRAHTLPGWLIETSCCWEKRERGRGSQGHFSRNQSKMESPKFPLIEKTLCHFPQLFSHLPGSPQLLSRCLPFPSAAPSQPFSVPFSDSSILLSPLPPTLGLNFSFLHFLDSRKIILISNTVFLLFPQFHLLCFKFQVPYHLLPDIPPLQLFFKEKIYLEHLFP